MAYVERNRYFMDVVIVCAADDDALNVAVGGVFGGVDVFEMGEALLDGLPVVVMLGLDVGPRTDKVVIHHY